MGIIKNSIRKTKRTIRNAIREEEYRIDYRLSHHGKVPPTPEERKKIAEFWKEKRKKEFQEMNTRDKVKTVAKTAGNVAVNSGKIAVDIFLASKGW